MTRGRTKLEARQRLATILSVNTPAAITAAAIFRCSFAAIPLLQPRFEDCAIRVVGSIRSTVGVTCLIRT